MRRFFVPVGTRYINRQVLGIFAALAILLSIALGDQLIQFLEKRPPAASRQTRILLSCCACQN